MGKTLPQQPKNNPQAPDESLIKNITELATRRSL
jgi:hypothetical protein